MWKRLALLAALPLAAAAQAPADPAASPLPPQAAPPAPAYAPPPPQAAPPAPAYPTAPVQHVAHSRQRDSWYIGFGLGAGGGSVDVLGNTYDLDELVYDDSVSVSFNFRVGATLSPNLLVGFDGGFVATTGEASGYDSTLQLNYYDVGLMYFPTGRGFYLRGATGLSSVVWEADGYADASAGGFNVLGGVGYAFWLGRAFNLTLNVEGARHFFDDEGFEGATTFAAWLGLDWY